MNNLMPSFLFLLCLFAPGYITPVGVFFPKMIFALLGMYFFIKDLKFEREVLSWISCFCIVFILYLVVCLFSKYIFGYDEILLLIVKCIFIPYFCALFFFAIKPSDQSNEDWFFDLLLGAFVIGFIFLLLELIFPAIQQWYLSYVSLADEWRQYTATVPFRALGIPGLSIYDASISTALIGIYIIPRMVVRKYSALFLLFIMIALLVQCGLFGRSGLMLLVSSYIVFFIKADKKYRKICANIFFLMMFVCILIYQFVDDEIIKFAFEIFINFGEGKGLRSDSTDDLIDNHLFMPKFEGFWGAGVWDPGGTTFPQYKTDSGLLLPLIAGGPVLLALVLYFLYKFNTSLKNDLLYFYDKKNSFLLFSGWAVACIFSLFFIIKAPIYLSSPIMTMFIFRWKFMRKSGRNGEL